jgi:FtsH-binding integral membrane protein
MALLAAGAILYNTSKIVRECNTEDYVGAALRLFGS